MPQTTVLIFRDASGKAPLLEWLGMIEKREPKVYAKCLQRIQLLGQQGFELQRPLAATLNDSVYELRMRHRSVNYRILYFYYAKERCVACLTHGLTKESEVPEADIQFAVNAKALVDGNRDRYTIAWEL